MTDQTERRNSDLNRHYVSQVGRRARCICGWTESCRNELDAKHAGIGHLNSIVGDAATEQPLAGGETTS